MSSVSLNVDPDAIHKSMLRLYGPPREPLPPPAPRIPVLGLREITKDILWRAKVATDEMIQRYRASIHTETLSDSPLAQIATIVYRYRTLPGLVICKTESQRESSTTVMKRLSLRRVTFRTFDGFAAHDAAGAKWILFASAPRSLDEFLDILGATGPGPRNDRRCTILLPDPEPGPWKQVDRTPFETFLRAEFCYYMQIARHLGLDCAPVPLFAACCYKCGVCFAYPRCIPGDDDLLRFS